MKVDQAEAVYGKYFAQGEKVRAEYVEKFHYRFTARYVCIGSRYKLFELLPLTSGKAAEYCFLTVDKVRGVIIPDTFNEHRARLMTFNPPTPPIHKLIQPQVHKVFAPMTHHASGDQQASPSHNGPKKIIKRVLRSSTWATDL